ncbi:MAG: anthranilate phosphoribosyltransferase [Acidimicrobiales bacterium]
MTLEDHGGWPAVLGSLSVGEDIGADAAEAVLATVLAGDATDAQLAAFVVALRQKGETVDEMTGLVRAMREASVPLDLPPETIDLVGAGGSRLGREAALNVSTMASFVAAGAGAAVCKHGNRKASSTSGSFDVLEALGINIELGKEGVEACVSEVGVGFAFARTFHPAMRFAGPVRAQLGIPTVFNILGPLSHPGRLTRQVVGVPDAETGERMAAVLGATGSDYAMVVTGDGGLDELSTTGPNIIHEISGGLVSTKTVSATDVGLPAATAEDISGGDAVENAEIATRLFNGEPGARRDIVVLNAAAGLVTAGVATDLVDGCERASAAIDSGAAATKLARLIELSQRL